LLERPEDGPASSTFRIDRWSRRLDAALGMLAEHLRAGDDQDVGQPAWADEAT